MTTLEVKLLLSSGCNKRWTTIFSVGETNGPMLRASFSCLSFTLLAGGLLHWSGTVDPSLLAAGAAAAASGLAGIAGNLGTKIVERLGTRGFRRFSAIDENHVIVRNLREAELAALHVVRERFDGAWPTDPDVRRRAASKTFSVDLAAYLAREGKKTLNLNTPVDRSDDGDLLTERNLLAELAKAFDAGLAMRHTVGTGASALAVLSEPAEKVVMTELQTGVAEDIPALFLAALRGGPDGVDGWFDLFVRDAGRRLREDPAFAGIWNAEQTALILDLVGEVAGRQGEIAGIVQKASESLISYADKLEVIQALTQRTAQTLECVSTSVTRTEVAIEGLADEVAKRVLEAFADRHRRSGFALPHGHDLSRSLPPRPLRCLGRGSDIEKLTSRLLEDRSPISVIVYGGPGLGKSTLVCEVSHRPEIAARYGTNVLFVQLEQVSDTRAMLAAIADALNITPQGSIGEMMASLGNIPSLLILDNLETVWASDPGACEAQLKSLEQFAAHTALVVTFRGADLPGAPRWSFRHNVLPLIDGFSRELFLEIAPRIAADDPELPELLAEFGGVPLAIELVALEAAPFDKLDQICARWKQIGTALAARRHMEAGRTTSLEYSIELSLNSPSRNPETFDALSAVALLHDGLDEIVAAKILGEDFYEAVRDLVGSGLGFRNNSRIDVLPPIRRYVLATYGITEDLVRRLVGAYWSLAHSVFGSGADALAALDAVVLAENKNFQTVFLFAASRVSRFEFLDLAQKVAEHHKGTREKFALFTPAQTQAYTRFLRAFQSPLEYFKSLSIKDKNIKEFTRSATVQYEIECLVDDLLVPQLFHQLKLMEEGLDELAPEVRLQLEPKVAELRRAYEHYSTDVVGGLDQPDRNKGWEMMLDVMAMDDERLGEESGTYFASLSVSINQDHINQILQYALPEPNPPTEDHAT